MKIDKLTQDCFVALLVVIILVAILEWITPIQDEHDLNKAKHSLAAANRKLDAISHALVLTDQSTKRIEELTNPPDYVYKVPGAGLIFIYKDNLNIVHLEFMERQGATVMEGGRNTNQIDGPEWQAWINGHATAQGRGSVAFNQDHK